LNAITFAFLVCRYRGKDIKKNHTLFFIKEQHIKKIFYDDAPKKSDLRHFFRIKGFFSTFF